MAETLQLRIVTPHHAIVDETVEAVTAEGTLGQFGVLPLHATFLSSLEPGRLSFRVHGGSERGLAVKGGYAEVRDDVMTVLADEAVFVEELDRKTAEEALRAAEARLEEVPFEDPAHDRARREVRWAEVRIALADG